MITIMAAGIGFLLIVAIVVGIADARNAALWREIAQERRERWEARRPSYHGIDARDDDAGNDDAWDDD